VWCIFLGAFKKLRKAAISFVMSVCPSARMDQQLGSHWTGFDETWYLSFSLKSVEKISLIKITYPVLYVKTFSHLWQYLVKFFLESEMF
jgi:hypothetical protein